VLVAIPAAHGGRAGAALIEEARCVRDGLPALAV